MDTIDVSFTSEHFSFVFNHSYNPRGTRLNTHEFDNRLRNNRNTVQVNKNSKSKEISNRVQGTLSPALEIPSIGVQPSPEERLTTLEQYMHHYFDD